MNYIQLLYVENITTRKQNKALQKLTFFMLIENITHHKRVDVIWSGEDGDWHTLAAEYHSSQWPDKEHWRAFIDFTLTETQSLPGNIRFGLRYRVFSDEHWDNNFTNHYVSEADSGIKLGRHKKLQNIGFGTSFNQDNIVPVTIAVQQSLMAKKVTIHWTTDCWKTTEQTPCQLKNNYWDKNCRSHARNPNQYGIQIWQGSINHADSFSLQYIICCEGASKIIWENNADNNYSLQRKQLRLLILNLHCYQEQNQDEKLTQIAKAINELEVDVVCLQEVAEYWRDGEGDWESNSAKIINDRLIQAFHIQTDWSHLGFDKYREGVAILSRYPLSNHKSRYVSDSDDIYDIHSRKVVFAQVHVPYIGAINVFSAHLSWFEDGFKEQFQRLHQWAEASHTKEVKATLLCGDFNITVGSSGYKLVVDSHHYDDQFLAANEQAICEPISKANDPHWQATLADDYRIDYIFMNKASELQVTAAKIVFTEQDYGAVSDHCGYFMSFEPSFDKLKKKTK